MNFSLYLRKYKNIKVYIHWTFSLLLLWIMVSNLNFGANINEILWTLGFVELRVAMTEPLDNNAVFLLITLGWVLSGYSLVEMEAIEINSRTFWLLLASVNLILAPFKLLPAIPIDGERVLRAF
jgi:Zn-dependent protease